MAGCSLGNRLLRPLYSQVTGVRTKLSVSQILKQYPKPKVRKSTLPHKIVNPTPNGFMDYDPEMEEQVTGRKFGFAPTPLPLPPHETFWEGYKPRVIGTTPKKRPKKRCSSRMLFALDRSIKPHQSMCAFCRGYGETKSTNIMYLNNFINPLSWSLYKHTRAGLCQWAESKVRLMVEEARANGFMPRQPPQPMAKKNWTPPGEIEDLHNYAWKPRIVKVQDQRHKMAHYHKQVEHTI